jgi:hypothetical protein
MPVEKSMEQKHFYRNSLVISFYPKRTIHSTLRTDPLLTGRKHVCIYSAFFLTVAIGNCMVKLIPPVNFCSDENIQTIFGTKLEDFLNYRIDYNSIS